MRVVGLWGDSYGVMVMGVAAVAMGGHTGALWGCSCYGRTHGGAAGSALPQESPNGGRRKLRCEGGQQEGIMGWMALWSMMGRRRGDEE